MLILLLLAFSLTEKARLMLISTLLNTTLGLLALGYLYSITEESSSSKFDGTIISMLPPNNVFFSSLLGVSCAQPGVAKANIIISINALIAILITLVQVIKM
jgi:hypothetical protein